MKRRKLLVAMVIAVVLLCMGCRNTSGTHSRTITDMKGRNIVLDGDVTRVVALTAAEVIDSIKRSFKELSDKAAAFSDQPTIYFEISPLKAGLWTAGKGTFMDEAASLLHAKNAFADITGWENLRAVKDGHILNLSDDSLVRPGPRLADGVKELYDFLYSGK